MSSSFLHVPRAPEDPLFLLVRQFNECKNPDKVDLSIGVFRHGNSQPHVLSVVRKVEQQLSQTTNDHNYLRIEGLKDITTLSEKLMFGAGCRALQEDRIRTVQCLSGTGGCRLALEVLGRFIKTKIIYLPKPTWGNHFNVARDSGFTDIREYNYYDTARNTLDLPSILKEIQNAPGGSIFLLQACAHNPTGIDPTEEQWKEIAEAMKARSIFPLFDTAYLGFVSGNPDQDAMSLRVFESLGLEMMVAVSFAKNFGLYNERVGVLSCICSSPEVADNILSQLKAIIRPMYSNPPAHGGHIVSTILNSPELNQEWRAELREMSRWMLEIRTELYEKLKQNGIHWPHIMAQCGMFAFTSLTVHQVEALRDRYHIFMLKNGRISICGLTHSNVSYVVDAIKSVLSDTP